MQFEDHKTIQEFCVSDLSCEMDKSYCRHTHTHAPKEALCRSGIGDVGVRGVAVGHVVEVTGTVAVVKRHTMLACPVAAACNTHHTGLLH